jgi:hypothetical protein
MRCADNLDACLGNAKAKVQAVERIANVDEKISILNVRNIVDLLDVRWMRQQ